MLCHLPKLIIVVLRHLLIDVAIKMKRLGYVLVLLLWMHLLIQKIDVPVKKDEAVFRGQQGQNARRKPIRLHDISPSNTCPNPEIKRKNRRFKSAHVSPDGSIRIE